MRYPKEKKPTAYIEKPKEPVILLIGFHQVPFEEETAWISQGIAGLVPNFLRLAGRHTIIDNQTLTQLLPKVDMSLMFEPIPEKEGNELCTLIQCDRLIYVYFTKENDVLRFHILDKQKEEKAEEELLGRVDDLPGVSRALTRLLAQRLGTNIDNYSEWDWYRFFPSSQSAFQFALLGNIYYSQSWFYTASVYLKKAMELDPQYPTAYSLLAQIYMFKDEIELVPPLLEKILSQDKNNYFQWYLLGIAYDYLGKNQEAIQCLEKSIAINPNFAEASSALAVLYSQEGLEAERWTALRKFLRSNPYTGGEIAAAEKYIRQFSIDPVTRLVSEKLRRHQVENTIFAQYQEEYEKNLEYLDSWNTTAGNPFQPHLVAFSPSQTIWVFGTKGIAQEFSLSGELLNQRVWQELLYPTGVTWGADKKTMYIADEVADLIHQYSNGALKPWSSEVRKPRGICILNGRFYTVNERNDEVTILDSSGKKIGSFSLPVRKTTKTGRYRGIFCAANGKIYVPEGLSNIIYVLTPSGQTVKQIGGYGFGPGEFGALTSAFVDSTGKIYTTEDFTHRIQVLDAEGTPIAITGQLGSLPGQFQTPVSIIAVPGSLFPDGKIRIFVADREGFRIQIFRLKK